VPLPKSSSPEEFEQFFKQKGRMVAASESVYGWRAWQPPLDPRGLGVLRPDVSKQGGITEVLWLWAEVAPPTWRLKPYLYSGAVAYVTTLQMAACMHSVEQVDLDIRSGILRNDGLLGPPQVVDGAVEIPWGAGAEWDFRHATKSRFP
jgi:L-alanine-DL-glutamate epimerase-like enolase superfamily enzyme